VLHATYAMSFLRVYNHIGMIIGMPWYAGICRAALSIKHTVSLLKLLEAKTLYSLTHDKLDRQYYH
jgi:hypothetical protein